MSDEELLQQFLAVASRATKAGKRPVAIVGILDIAKDVVKAQVVKIEPASAIVPVTGLPRG